MKRSIVALMMLCATAASAEVTIKFAKTAYSVKESAAYAELTVNKTGKEAARVKFATVCGTAQPGREYYATNGVLEWVEGKTTAQKIRVRLMPDEVAKYEENKVFSVVLRALDEAELAEGEALPGITAGEATVTVTETTKANPGTVSVAGYYDYDDEWHLFDNAKKPSLTVGKNGFGGYAAVSLVRTGGTDGAIAVTVTAAPSTAKLGADFTLGEDSDVVAGTEVIEWADGEGGEKLLWVSAVDDEDYGLGVYSKTATLKFASTKDATHAKATLGASSIALVVRDDSISETIADFNARIKSTGASISTKSCYLSSESAVLTTPLITGKSTQTFSVKCTGPGFFATYGSVDGEGGFSWKCGKMDGSANGDVQMVLPSGTSTINFTYTGRADDENAVAMIGSEYEEDRPFSWVSFADSVPTPFDKAVARAEDIEKLSWTVPERAHDYEDDAGLHYRVRVGEAASKLDKAPLFVTNVIENAVVFPEGMLEKGKTYYWRVDYLLGDDGDDQQMVAVSKSVWSFTVGGEDVPMVAVTSGADVYGNAVSNGVVTLHRGVKVEWELGAGEEGSATLKVLSGKLPTGLKLAKNSKTKVWTISGTPTAAGSFRATLGGTVGKVACQTLDLEFQVDDLGLGIGNYSAMLVDDGKLAEMASRRLANLTFTATGAGKLTAKVLIGGKTYSFSGTGYDVCERAEESDDEDVTADVYDNYLTATMFNVQKVGGVSYTNELTIQVRDAAAGNLDALGKAIGTVELKMCVLKADGKSVNLDGDDEGILFTGSLWRDNSSIPEVQAQLADFEGYYTLALFPEAADSPDAPSGNGYLTLTVDAKGKAKIAGKLADGTSISSTVTGGFEGLLADWAGSRVYRLVLPVFSATATRVIGGELVLEWDEETGEVLVDSDALLTWADDSSTAMFDTAAEEWSGFKLDLMPTGGWFDTVSNLQAHYARTALTVDPEGGAGEFSVELENDKPVIATASGVTLKIARATGIVTGTVLLQDEYTGQTTKASHAGVLLTSYQLDTAEGIWSAGYALISRKAEKKTVKVSRPFCVYAEDVDPDFAAGDEGNWQGEEIVTEE